MESIFFLKSLILKPIYLVIIQISDINFDLILYV